MIVYLTYSGIYREVSLIEKDKHFVERALVDANQDILNIRIKLDEAKKHHLKFEIYDEDKCISTCLEEASLKDHHFKYPHQLTLWDLDYPKLYKLKVYLNDRLQETIRFGARYFAVDENHFYLNGKPVFLRGLNRHQSYPYVGYAMPKSAQIEDADQLKYELGCTMVRSSHYPPSEHFLNRCDEIGLLVFTELPGWQHIGDDTWKENALKDLEALTLNDYNHPSVAIIGTRINESQDDHDFYTKTRDLVKSIDQTRPTGGVRFFGKSELLEDIYTLNDFSHRGNNRGLVKKKTMTNKKHPYLITEYNGHMFPTKSSDNEIRRKEHALRHYTVLNEAYKHKGIMGAIGWCMNDYNTHREFGSNNRICFHGVNDMNRNPKYAASVYASQRKEPFMDVLSMMHIGDLDHGELKEVIVATNLEAVDVYKNDVFIGRFTPSKQFKHLPHPPVIIDDFIGNQIYHNEDLNAKDSKRIKKILLKTLKKGLKMSLLTKLQMGYILLKNKLTYQDAVRFYTTYIGGWGEKQKVYRFEGILEGKTVLKMEKGLNDRYTLSTKYDDSPIVIEDTYEVRKVTLSLTNELHEKAFYTNAVVEINTSDNLYIIGPSKRLLDGGIESFWLKAVKPGIAWFSVTYKDHEVKHILNIEKKRS